MHSLKREIKRNVERKKRTEPNIGKRNRANEGGNNKWGGCQAIPQQMKGVPVRTFSMWFFMCDHKQPLFPHSCVYLNLCLQHLMLFVCKPAAGLCPDSIKLHLRSVFWDILGWGLAQWIAMRAKHCDHSDWCVNQCWCRGKSWLEFKCFGPG